MHRAKIPSFSSSVPTEERLFLSSIHLLRRTPPDFFRFHNECTLPPMGFVNKLKELFTTKSDARFECQMCGETFDTVEGVCPECGGQVTKQGQLSSDNRPGP